MYTFNRPVGRCVFRRSVSPHGCPKYTFMTLHTMPFWLENVSKMAKEFCSWPLQLRWEQWPKNKDTALVATFNVIEYRSVLYGTWYVEKYASNCSCLYKSFCWMAKGLCVPLQHLKILVPILYDIGYFRYLQNDTLHCKVDWIFDVDVDENIRENCAKVWKLCMYIFS